MASTVDTGEARGTRMTAAAVRHRSAFLLLCLLAGAARAVSVGGIDDVDASYRFLVSERAQGGVADRKFKAPRSAVLIRGTTRV